MVPGLKLLFEISLVKWIDGVRFGICKKRDWKKQKDDYSGEKKTQRRKIILILDSEGKIVGVVMNCPGVWADSKCTDVGGLYDLIGSLVDGYSIATNTSFHGDLIHSKVIRIKKTCEYLPAGMSHEEYELLEELIIRARQPAEWTNNCLIQAFHHLQRCLRIVDDGNGDLMMTCLLLHTYQTTNCNQNQVKKYFHILEQEVKEEEEAHAATGDDGDDNDEEEKTS
jgi:hypothetical protein